MSMKVLTNQKMLTFLGAVLGLLIVGLRGVMLWTTLAIIGAVFLLLTFAIPSKYNPQITTFGILAFGGGIVVVIILPSLFGSIPYITLRWAVFVWLAIAVAVGVLWPFPVLKRLHKKAQANNAGS